MRESVWKCERSCRIVSSSARASLVARFHRLAPAEARKCRKSRRRCSRKDERHDEIALQQRECRENGTSSPLLCINFSHSASHPRFVSLCWLQGEVICSAPLEQLLLVPPLRGEVRGCDTRAVRRANERHPSDAEQSERSKS